MIPSREMFWHIGHIWIFYLLSVLAIIFFLAGVGCHIYVWRKSARSMAVPFSKDALKRMIQDIFIEGRILQGELSAGILHLFIFWGFLLLFLGTCTLAVHDYIVSFLEGRVYLIFSLIMEIGGIMLLIGIIWALIRRYLQRVPRLERRWEDAIVPLWLLLTVITGFVLEGTRLASQDPSWGPWSFMGWWIGGFSSASAAELLQPYLWWGHALICLGFIAVIPYSKLFHILGAPATIYFQNSPRDTVLDVEEGAGEFDLGEVIFLDGCMRCGRCVASCPSAGADEPFAPRDFVQAMGHKLWQEHFPLGDIRFLSPNKEEEIDEKFWYCTTCRACLEVCPIYGAAFEVVTKQRVQAVEDSVQVPKLLNQTLEKLHKYDNPWESSKRNRAAWAEGLDLPDLTAKDTIAGLCYFVGCTTSFDVTAQVIARSFSRILLSAGVNFGILGKKEPCCGDIARRVGEFGLFEEQKEGCLELFDKYQITDLVTSSPHCFHTFRNEYPGALFRVRHYTLVLRELLANGGLEFKNKIESTVTYHDPCYLGRHNRIFDEPREIIRSIPGVSLVEMEHNKADSLCCGGGGGRVWQDLSGEGKMNVVRIREAEATGADIIVTTCPLCLIMLEDARKVAGLNDRLRVMDLNELVLQALGETDA